jgi:hypothetical protein
LFVRESQKDGSSQKNEADYRNILRKKHIVTEIQIFIRHIKGE